MSHKVKIFDYLAACNKIKINGSGACACKILFQSRHYYLNEPSEHLRPKYIFERVETGVSLSWIQAWINDQCCQFVI